MSLAAKLTRHKSVEALQAELGSRRDFRRVLGVWQLTAIGLGPEKTSPNIQQQRALLLSVANGLVQIYRPSQDILVMTRDRGYPIVLARCPTPPPTPAPEDSASSSTPMDTPSSSSAAQ